MILDIIALSANSLALLGSVITIAHMIRKDLKSLTLLLLQISNIASQCFAIYFFFLNNYTVPDLLFLDKIFNIASMLSLVTVFFIALVDCDVLSAFSALNPAINPSRIKILRGALTSLFVILFGPDLGLNLYCFVTAANATNSLHAITPLLSALFGFLIVLYDNIQAIYLAILVLKITGTTASKQEIAKLKYRYVIFVNVSLVGLDNIGLICDIIYVLTSNYAFAMFAIAFVGFHSSLLLVVVSTLKRVLHNDNAPLIITATATKTAVATNLETNE